MRPPPDLFVTLTADPAEIARARADLEGWLRSAADVDRDVHEDLQVVASELLANAIRASSGDGEVTMRASHAAGAVTLEVVNPVTEWVSPAERWDFDDPLRTGGRGLLIVSALVDDVRVEHDLTKDCTVVSARRQLDPSRHEAEPEPAEVADLEPQPGMTGNR